jgi:hypothetical protein
MKQEKLAYKTIESHNRVDFDEQVNDFASNNDVRYTQFSTEFDGEKINYILLMIYLPKPKPKQMEMI